MWPRKDLKNISQFSRGLNSLRICKPLILAARRARLRQSLGTYIADSSDVVDVAEAKLMDYALPFTAPLWKFRA